MLYPQAPENEKERIAALRQYNILDTLPEKDFDDITRIASEICNTPISLITLVDVSRQWFKSHHGLDVTETPREHAFCAHAINKPSEPFIVPDSSKDERFSDNPLATGEPFVTFYAGIPLVTEEGYALGTLCVIDNKPRDLTPHQLETMQALANQIVCQLELRRKLDELTRKQTELKLAYEDLDKFAYIASHDIKSPLNNIVGLTDLMKDHLAGQDEEQGVYIDHLNTAAKELVTLVDGILAYSKSTHILSLKKEQISVAGLIRDVISLLQPSPHISIIYPQNEDTITTSYIALKQILLNLCSNAIKFNNKEKGEIKIDFRDDETSYNFLVSDNGPGIASEDQDRVFDLFYMLRNKNNNSVGGTGIGLSTVKRLVEKLGGYITLTSAPGKGATFYITINK